MGLPSRTETLANSCPRCLISLAFKHSIGPTLGIYTLIMIFVLVPAYASVTAIEGRASSVNPERFANSLQYGIEESSPAPQKPGVQPLSRFILNIEC